MLSIFGVDCLHVDVVIIYFGIYEQTSKHQVIYITMKNFTNIAELYSQDSSIKIIFHS